MQHYLHLLSVCLDPSPSRIYDPDARLDTLNGPTRATLGGFKPVYGEHRLAWLPAPPSRLKPRYGASPTSDPAITAYLHKEKAPTKGVAEAEARG